MPCQQADATSDLMKHASMNAFAKLYRVVLLLAELGQRQHACHLGGEWRQW